MNHTQNFLSVAALLLGGVFAFSGIAKLVAARKFRDTVFAMEMLPVWAVWPVTLLVSLFEALWGVLLFAGYRSSWSGGLLALLLALMIAVLVRYRMRGGYELKCGCFADFDNAAPTVDLIVRNSVLLAIALFVGVGPDVASPFGRALPDWFSLLVTAAGCVLFWLLLIAFVKTLRILGSSEVEIP